MQFYSKTVPESLKDLDVCESGLSNIEAEERLIQYGLNVIKVKGEPLWHIIIEPFLDIFMVVLLFATAISLFYGDFLDAIIIITIITIDIIIYYVQRFSTERVLRSLRQQNALLVEVLRENKSIMIDASLLVPGDIVLLNEGDKIPADARVLTSNSLRVDESQFTGESLPVEKQIEPLADGKEIYDQSNMVFQGSYVVGGEASVLIVSTGNSTEFGHLASLSKDILTVSPVQIKINKLVARLIIIIIIIAVVAFILSMYRGMEVIESIKFIIALSVSAVPEGLTAAISIVLVLGMRRMAAKKALVRNMAAIETVGTITTIATDKTGTLTENKLTVHDIWQPNFSHSDLVDVITRATNIRAKKVHDPLDTALSDYVELKNTSSRIQRGAPVSVFPFEYSLSMSGNLWENKDKYDLYIKGAPEKILDRCDIEKSQRSVVEEKLYEMTSNGYRVIAFAHMLDIKKINSLSAFDKSAKLEFDGFSAVSDILRPEAKQAIREAIKAGVTVRMITGDHFETAYHIGMELGLITSRNQVFDSRKMSEMTDEQLELAVNNIRIFSRVVPEHKYRILAILKKNNITAMTGDGVNDVPALANAHVGVAMGSGSSIAKDAGDIILMDDNFKSIVEAIHEGRTIYANIKRMVVYLLATNAGEVIVALGALISGFPIPLLPAQILWVNLVTDTLMVVPLGLEPGERRNMNKPPQPSNAPLLSRFMTSRIFLIAVTMGTITLGMYYIFYNLYGVDYARSIAMHTLVVMQWSSAFCARSDYETIFTRIKRINKPFIIGLSLAVVLQLFTIFGPLGVVLQVKRLSIIDTILASLIAIIIPIVVIELHKYVGRRFFNKGSRQKTKFRRNLNN